MSTTATGTALTAENRSLESMERRSAIAASATVEAGRRR
jgi:hypothetical protein